MFGGRHRDKETVGHEGEVTDGTSPQETKEFVQLKHKTESCKHDAREEDQLRKGSNNRTRPRTNI